MNKTALKSVLGRNHWFAGLPPALAEGILDAGRLRRLRSTMIYSAHDSADGIVALISGQVRISRVTSSGQPSFLIVASPGSWIGMSSALDSRPHGYDAFAVGNTVIFQLSQERMKALIGDRIDYYSAFVMLMCDHYRVAIDYLIAQRSRRPLQILAHELLRLADRHGRRTTEGILIDLRLSQEDLAVMIGVGRQTINRLLKSLEQDGVASVNYASVTIQNLEALQRIRSAEDWQDM